jgi:hypothetical protein
VNLAIKNDISPVASLSLAPTDQVVFRDVPVIVLAPLLSKRLFPLLRKPLR